MMYDGAGAGFMPILPFLIVSIPFAIGFYFVAGRVGQPPWLWAVLALVPFVNFFFYIYAFFFVMIYMLDRLNQSAPPPRT